MTRAPTLPRTSWTTRELYGARFPPDVLAGALQDRVAPTSGRLLRAVPVTRAALLLGSTICLLISGCAPAWATAGALADTAAIATARYQAWTHAERRRILDGVRPTCGTDEACYRAAIGPFEARQAPVLACLAVAAPLVEGAALAAEGRDSTAALAIVPRLASQMPVCVEAIRAARSVTP